MLMGNPSGGWRWHWRAWRAQARWQTTAAQLQAWLMAQADMPAHTLVWVGASAGWMMPTAWLQRFAHIHAWDIDPMAQALCERRHGRALRAHGVQMHWHRGDALAALPQLVAQHPQALFWFDNLLGQLCLMPPDPPDRVPERLRQLRRQLNSVAWGSVHDRASGPVRADSAMPEPMHTTGGQSTEGPAMQAWLQRAGALSPWSDHHTATVFDQTTPVQWLAWPFWPRHWHVLEIGWRPAPDAVRTQAA